jgi:hypothetical protein
MLATLGVVVCVLGGGCRFTGTQTFYGVSKNDMNFAEVDLVLVEREQRSKIQGVPFVAFGAGRLPAEYGPERNSFQRTSIGQKVRYPFHLIEEKVTVYIEAGGAVNYYSGGTIAEPWDLEAMAGLGSQFDLGKGWGLDLGARVLQPTNNGNGHKDTEMVHSPHQTRAQFVFGLKKDF